MIRVLIVTLVMLFSSLRAYASVDFVNFNNVMKDWNARSEKSFQLEDCRVYEKEADKVRTLFVNPECDFVEFAAYAFKRECKNNLNQLVRVVGHKVETSFITEPQNCGSGQPVSTLLNSTKNKTSNNRYYIQFFAGVTKPELQAIHCKVKETEIYHIGTKYYVLSPPLSISEAKLALEQLKTRCGSTGWIRKFPKS